MTLFAAPPVLFVGSGHDAIRSEYAVAGGVPAGSYGGVTGGQIVLTRDYPGTGTVRTALSPLYAGSEAALPLVSCLAAPPDFPLASRTHLPGIQRSVLRRVPLCQNRIFCSVQKNTSQQDKICILSAERLPVFSDIGYYIFYQQLTSIIKRPRGTLAPQAGLPMDFFCFFL